MYSVPSLITLTTDFGISDPYVGAMKGVILGINPCVNIVDISHEVGPQSVLEGAYVITSSHRYFPKGTIHIVVVDPGVGTSRSALLLATPEAYFVAPDNGLLTYIVEQGLGGEPGVLERSRVALPPGYRAYSLTNPEFWRHPVSYTFHGRDIFAPVAAHLSAGVPADRMGQEVTHISWLQHRQPRWDGKTLVGLVVHVDRFGNLVTDIPSGLLPREGPVTVEVKGRRIVGLSSSYADGGRLLALVGSQGNLEVAVRNGSAARVLRAKVGDPVKVDAGGDTPSA